MYVITSNFLVDHIEKIEKIHIAKMIITNAFEEFVEKHLDKGWYWGYRGLSLNPSITPEFIEKHLDKEWDWGRYGLSSNKFTNPILERKRVVKEAAIIIQRKFLDWFYKPVCKDGTPGLHYNVFVRHNQ